MLSDTLPGTLDGPQRVLVISGANGLGLAVAERFHRAEALVHIADPSAESMVGALAELPGSHGTVADCSQEQDVAAVVQEALDWMGGIDVLVNCIDEAGPTKSLEATTVEEWDLAMAANLKSPFLCTRAVAGGMKDQMSGAVINLGAHAGSRGLARKAAYAASKAGIEALTKTTARELGPYNVRCNAVLPGLVADDTSQELVSRRARREGISREEAESELLERVSMRSWIEPAEVADLIFFLGSDAARHVCGQSIGICGHLE